MEGRRSVRGPLGPGAGPRRGRARLRPASFLAALLCAAAVGLLVLPGPGWGGASVAGPAGAPVAVSPSVHRALPHLGPGPQRPLPFASGSWYTQEGATLSELNGSVTTGVASLVETIPLVVSPHSTGYELNGLSDTGDWYQIVVGDNWPGCSSGFEEILEVWDNAQGSGPVTCDPTVSLSAGDLIRLSLSYDAAHDVCLGLSDLTTQRSHSVCQAQPDIGGSRFDFLARASNSNGYYSGTMTETINLTTASCPDYTDLPRVQFDFPRGFFVTQYVPWSDEWELGGAGTSCYSSPGLVTSIAATDPTSQYVDTASGTGYGPHWEDGQNFSYVNTSYGFRFETDPTPLTSVALVGPASPVPANATFTLTASTTGGLGPYRALWTLDGAISGIGPSVKSLRESLPGSYGFSAYGVDSQDDVLGPSTSVSVEVTGPLSVGRVAASPVPDSADVGQNVTFRASLAGGVPPFAYSWSGLPVGCAGANVSAIACAPTSAGTSAVVVQVTDSNGSVATSPPLDFAVYPTLSVGVRASTNRTDVGLPVNFSASPSGGSGNVSYVWFGLPVGCGGTGPSVLCAPAAAGVADVTVLATDSDAGWARSAAAVVRVAPAPSVVLVSSPPYVDAGDAVDFSANVSGGTPGFTYTWVGLGSACTGASGPAVVCPTAYAGTLEISVTAVDAVGGSATSRPVGVDVYARPVVTLELSSARISLGGVVNLSAQVLGGSPGLSFSWSGLPPGCVGSNAPRIACGPTASGTFQVGLEVTDAARATARANGTLTVESLVPPSPAPPFSVPGGAFGLLALVVVAGVAGLAAFGASRRRRSPAEPAEGEGQA